LQRSDREEIAQLSGKKPGSAIAGRRSSFGQIRP